MVLKIENFGKYTRNTWRGLKCGAGGQLERLCDEKLLQRVKEKISYIP
jgi:hypothetical protein